MSSSVDAITRFAKEVINAERLTVPGRVNVYGLFIVAVVIITTGILDIIQAFVRIWNDDYTTGAPSVTTLLLVFGGLMLGCVLICSWRWTTRVATRDLAQYLIRHRVGHGRGRRAASS